MQPVTSPEKNKDQLEKNTNVWQSKYPKFLVLSVEILTVLYFFFFLTYSIDTSILN